MVDFSLSLWLGKVKGAHHSNLIFHQSHWQLVIFSRHTLPWSKDLQDLSLLFHFAIIPVCSQGRQLNWDCPLSHHRGTLHFQSSLSLLHHHLSQLGFNRPNHQVLSLSAPTKSWESQALQYPCLHSTSRPKETVCKPYITSSEVLQGSILGTLLFLLSGKITAIYDLSFITENFLVFWCWQSFTANTAIPLPGGCVNSPQVILWLDYYLRLVFLHLPADLYSLFRMQLLDWSSTCPIFPYLTMPTRVVTMLGFPT